MSPGASWLIVLGLWAIVMFINRPSKWESDRMIHRDAERALMHEYLADTGVDEAFADTDPLEDLQDTAAVIVQLYDDPLPEITRRQRERNAMRAEVLTCPSRFEVLCRQSLADVQEIGTAIQQFLHPNRRYRRRSRR